MQIIRLKKIFLAIFISCKNYSTLSMRPMCEIASYDVSRKVREDICNMRKD